jgi:hypothetical protein
LWRKGCGERDFDKERRMKNGFVAHVRRKDENYMAKYFAHSSNKAGSPWEPLNEHIQLVAERAEGYARTFDAGEEARIAGLWHDLGKYSDVFIKRLRGEVSGLDHWSIGAIATLHTFREKAIAVALAIQGHPVAPRVGAWIVPPTGETLWRRDGGIPPQGMEGGKTLH